MELANNYINNTLHISPNRFIEVIKNMPLDMKLEINELLSKEIKKEQKQPKAKKEKSSDKIVAYTMDGKGLTQKEYAKHISDICDEIDKGIGLIPHEEVFAKYDKMKKEYESNLVKSSK